MRTAPMTQKNSKIGYIKPLSMPVWLCQANTVNVPLWVGSWISQLKVRCSMGSVHNLGSKWGSPHDFWVQWFPSHSCKCRKIQESYAWILHMSSRNFMLNSVEEIICLQENWSYELILQKLLELPLVTHLKEGMHWSQLNHKFKFIFKYMLIWKSNNKNTDLLFRTTFNSMCLWRMLS